MFKFSKSNMDDIKHKLFETMKEVFNYIIDTLSMCSNKLPCFDTLSLHIFISPTHNLQFLFRRTPYQLYFLTLPYLMVFNTTSP